MDTKKRREKGTKHKFGLKCRVRIPSKYKNGCRVAQGIRAREQKRSRQRGNKNVAQSAPSRHITENAENIIPLPQNRSSVIGQTAREMWVQRPMCLNDLYFYSVHAENSAYVRLRFLRNLKFWKCNFLSQSQTTKFTHLPFAFMGKRLSFL